MRMVTDRGAGAGTASLCQASRRKGPRPLAPVIITRRGPASSIFGSLNQGTVYRTACSGLAWGIGGGRTLMSGQEGGLSPAPRSAQISEDWVRRAPARYGRCAAQCRTVQIPHSLPGIWYEIIIFLHFAPSHNAPGSLRIGRGRRHRSDAPSGHTEGGPKSRPRTRTVPEPRGAPGSAPCAPPGSAPRASCGGPATLLAIPSQATARDNRPQPNPVARGLPPR